MKIDLMPRRRGILWGLCDLCMVLVESPGFVWFVGGLLIGLAVGLLVALE